MGVFCRKCGNVGGVLGERKMSLTAAEAAAPPDRHMVNKEMASLLSSPDIQYFSQNEAPLVLNMS